MSVRVALCAALLVACGGSKKDDTAPTCEQVVDHLLTVTKQKLAGHGGMELKMRKQWLDHCAANLSDEARHCFINAKTLDALADCGQRFHTGGDPNLRPRDLRPQPRPQPPQPTTTTGSANP
jgi:hypothetical protein